MKPTKSLENKVRNVDVLFTFERHLKILTQTKIMSSRLDLGGEKESVYLP